MDLDFKYKTGSDTFKLIAKDTIKGDKGDSYVITEDDYQEIADVVAEQYTVELKGYADSAKLYRNEAQESEAAAEESAAVAVQKASDASASAASASASAAAAKYVSDNIEDEVDEYISEHAEELVGPAGPKGDSGVQVVTSESQIEDDANLIIVDDSATSLFVAEKSDIDNLAEGLANLQDEVNDIDRVEWFTYSDGTYEAVKASYEKGNIPRIKDGNVIYVLSVLADTLATFNALDSSRMYWMYFLTNGSKAKGYDEFVKPTDYATSAKGGTIKIGSWRGVNIDSGFLYAIPYSLEDYNTRDSYTFISKGTLENVLAERITEPQFELIEEITLDEDVPNIIRNAEPNGTPYNFKKVKLVIDTPVAMARTVFASINGKRSISNNVCRSNAFYNSSYTGYGCVDIDVTSGFVESDFYFSYGSLANASSVGATRAPTAWRTVTDVITEVTLGAYSANLVKDTNIKIYAVRA